MLKLRVFRMPPPTKVMMQRHSAVYQCCELLTTANSKLNVLLSLIAFFVFLLQCWFYKEATLLLALFVSISHSEIMAVNCLHFVLRESILSSHVLFWVLTRDQQNATLL